MKILLSAYACEPNRGSEPGVGWNWALELEKLGNDVYVLTRTNNKRIIDDYFFQEKKITNLHFIYYDLPEWLLFLKKNGLSVNLYYLLWQFGIISIARKNHIKIKFDIVHHITFGVFRHPSFLYKLDIPFVFGPLGGGEHSPKSLKKQFSKRHRLIETIRSLINFISKFNPVLSIVYQKSLLIFTKTNETKEFVPQKYHYKTYNQSEIGIYKEDILSKNKTSNIFKVLYVGRLIYWKGLDLALTAFAEFSKLYDDEIEFIIIGKGDYKKDIDFISNELNIKNKITLVDWISQKELKEYYINSNVMLFPSLHDSSGNVVLEALSFGLPVICLDCGGPAVILGEDLRDLIVPTKNKSKNEIISLLAQNLLKLTNSKYQSIISEKSTKRAAALEWSRVVKKAFDLINEKIESK